MTLRQWIVTVLLATAAILLIAAAFLAWRAANTPFPGFLPSPPLVASDLEPPTWAGYAADIRFPDHVVALDDEPLKSTGALMHALARHKPGDVVTLTVQAKDGTLRDVEVQLTPFPSLGLVNFFVVPYILALVYLAVGTWIFLEQRRAASAQVFAVLCALIALVLGLLLDVYTTHWFPRVWVTALSLTGSVAIHLTLIFPQRVRFLERASFLHTLAYVPGIAIAIVNQLTILNFQSPRAYFDPWYAAFIFGVVGIVAHLGMLLYRSRYSQSPIVQTQARMILGGSLLAFGPFAVWFLITGGAAFPPALILPWFILFPLSIAYAILRYRLFNITLAISRGIAYTLLSAVMVGVYFLLLYLIRQGFGARLSVTHPVLISIFVLSMTLLLNRAWSHTQRVVDQVLLGEIIDRRELMDQFAAQLPELMELSSILETLDQTLKKGWQPDVAALFLYDSQRGCYVPHVIGSGALPSITFEQEGPLAHHVLERRESLYVYKDRPLPSELAAEREALESLAPALFIPVPSHGWLMLSPMQGQRTFSTESLDILESLSSHLAVALEKARLIDDLKRRVEEMDVLRLVGQAVNFTTGIDDLMELVYAQAGRVLDTTNFYIALHNQEKGSLSFAFYVENNERLYPDEEWSIETGLTGAIVRSGRPIVTENYALECQRRGIALSGPPGRAWMGVPLSAGDQVIGVMNVSSFDPAVSYSEEQLKIFSAIADQAAAMLEKARLYQEMEERSRQLSALNEVGSVVTSTLDLDAVLSLIMEKAVELMEAEAGSLILIDRDTGELVFEVTTGPGSADLAGTRLPPDTGVAGAVIQTSEPMIIKEAQTDQRWYQGLDAHTAFITKSIIAVPMISRDTVIGAIELLNRRDNVPFDEEDQRLLTAFATDAAIAIENARLFTQTDQALAERVEELSMMQRIDRELNASLDYQQVMEITLEWGLEMTGADTGLLAMMVETEDEGRGLRILVSRGYPEEFVSTYSEDLWPLDRGIAGRVARTGKPSLVKNVVQDGDYFPSVSGMVSQLTVPIQREAETIGIIALESSSHDCFNQEALEFITRLADHATIAIENARLFDQVRQANQAKTEFISFVSHELKQPMTSMKGYADLLLKETAGELTDMQRDFLRTMRTNVDRMDNLVSELLDVSRIESGRIQLELNTFPIGRAIENVVQATQGQIEEKEQKLTVDIAPDLPPVRADEERLIQVLTNLVSNAHKYTPEGGRIAISARQANGQGETDEDRLVQCSVKDTGIGITPEDQERLFTKYFRADHPIVSNVPGTGLGLVITKNLVEMHGGEIWLESEPGEGSTFTFTVPAAQ